MGLVLPALQLLLILVSLMFVSVGMARGRDSRGRFLKGGSRGARAKAMLRSGGRRLRGYASRFRSALSQYHPGILGKTGIATIALGPVFQTLAGWKDVADIYTWYGYSKKRTGNTIASLFEVGRELLDRTSIIWIGFKPSDGGTWGPEKGGMAAWNYVWGGGAQIALDYGISRVLKDAGNKFRLPFLGKILGSYGKR